MITTGIMLVFETEKRENLGICSVIISVLRDDLAKKK